MPGESQQPGDYTYTGDDCAMVCQVLEWCSVSRPLGRGSRDRMTREHFYVVAGVLLVASALLALVRAPGSNEGPRRSEEMRFSLIQSVSAQTAPADQMPTCDQILSEFEADPETQQ